MLRSSFAIFALHFLGRHQLKERGTIKVDAQIYYLFNILYRIYNIEIRKNDIIKNIKNQHNVIKGEQYGENKRFGYSSSCKY